MELFVKVEEGREFYMVRLRKFKDRGFLTAFLVTVNLWVVVGYLLLATVVHIPFITFYNAFFAEAMPLEEWIGTLIFFELVTAMGLSWILTKRFIVPWVNKHLLGVE